MSKLLNQTWAGACDVRLLRFARNDADGLMDAVIARSAQRDEAISVTRMALDGRTGNVAVWQNEPNFLLAVQWDGIQRFGWPAERC